MHLAHEKHMLPDVSLHERKVDSRAGRWALHPLLRPTAVPQEASSGLEVTIYAEHTCAWST